MKTGKNPVPEKLLEKIREEQTRRSNIQEKGKRDQEPNLLNISDALDEYYMLEKLKLFCSYLSYRRMVNENVIGYEKVDFKMMPAIFELLNTGSVENKAILIYYKLCRLFEKSTEDGTTQPHTDTIFTAIENLILQNKDHFTAGELVEIYSHLTNYSIYQMNQGNHTYFVKNLTHNQNLIRIQESDREPFAINSGVYKNMITLILKISELEDAQLAQQCLPAQYAGNIEWAHHFAEKYKDHLPKESKDTYYAYCKALICFRSGEYPRAFAFLQDLQRVREVFLNFDCKMLRLQLLLELLISNEKEANGESAQKETEMKEEMENLRNMLRYDRENNPKLNYQKAYFQDFLNLIRKFYSFFKLYAWMFEFGDDNYFAKRKQLKTAILQHRYAYRQWFLDKLEDIK